MKNTADDTTGESTEYDWDFRNRLVAVRELDDQDNVVFEVNYTYDVFDRRIAKSVDADGAGSGAAVATYFVYDGEHILLEFDDGGDLTQRYLHGPVIDQILAAEDVTSLSSAGDVVWPLADNQGTIRDLIDSTGTVLNHLKYNAFGQITSESNSAVDFLFAYTGRERDEETGLYYYRARYYDPAVGRFVSEDPIGFAAGDVNVSRYVGNGPVGSVDPNGLEQQENLRASVPIPGLGALGRTPGAKPGFVESLVPVWGSGRMAIHHFQEGHVGMGVAYSTLAISDILLLKSIGTAIGKVGWTAFTTPGMIRVIRGRAAAGNWHFGWQAMEKWFHGMPIAGLIRRVMVAEWNMTIKYLEKGVLFSKQLPVMSRALASATVGKKYVDCFWATIGAVNHANFGIPQLVVGRGALLVTDEMRKYFYDHPYVENGLSQLPSGPITPAPARPRVTPPNQVTPSPSDAWFDPRTGQWRPGPKPMMAK